MLLKEKKYINNKMVILIFNHTNFITAFFILKKNTYNYINGCVKFLTKCYFHNSCAQTTRKPAKKKFSLLTVKQFYTMNQFDQQT